VMGVFEGFSPLEGRTVYSWFPRSAKVPQKFPKICDPFSTVGI